MLAKQSQTDLQYLAEQLYGFPLLLFGCNDILVVASALGKWYFQKEISLSAEPPLGRGLQMLTSGDQTGRAALLMGLGLWYTF